MASLCSAIKLYIKEKLSEIFTARIFISNLEQITKNGCMGFLGQIGLTAENDAAALPLSSSFLAISNKVYWLLKVK